jgi:hypothetical protein
MNNNNEKIKIGLLALIAVTLIVQTFYLVSGNGLGANGASTVEASAPMSNMVAGSPTDQATSNVPPVAEPVAQSASRTKTTVKFEQTEHDFGQVKQETENKKIFKFTNTGTEPLVIENAVGSCGCTVPDYPQRANCPGQNRGDRRKLQAGPAKRPADQDSDHYCQH